MVFHLGTRPEHSNSDRSSARTWRRAVIAILAAGVVSSAQAQSALPLTMAEAEDLALAAEPGQPRTVL